MKDLNLIPKSYIEAKRKKLKKVYSTFAIICIALVLIIMIAAPIAIRFNLQRQLDGLDKQVKETSNYQSIEDQINAINDLYKQRENEGNKLRNYGIDIKAIFDGIEKALPEKLFLMNFATNAATNGTVEVSLDGTSASYDDIATFVNYLRKNALFENVIISSVKKGTTSATLSGLTPVAGKNASAQKPLPSPTPAKSESVLANPANQAAAGTTINTKGGTTSTQDSDSYSFNIIIYLKAGK